MSYSKSKKLNTLYYFVVFVLMVMHPIRFRMSYEIAAKLLAKAEVSKLDCHGIIYFQATSNDSCYKASSFYLMGFFKNNSQSDSSQSK